MSKTKQKIIQEVFKLLRCDDQVNSTNISVEMSDGVIKLTGTVPTYASRSAAESDALRVSGVNSVDNQLLVSLPGNYSNSSDAQIHFELEKALSLEKDIFPDLIHITVDRGNVILNGSVERYWKKQRVEEIALGIEGVVSLLNEITIVPSSSASDETIAEHIAHSLDQDISIAVDSVDIKVENGKVTLKGIVPDSDAHARVTDIIRNIKGVTEIQNKLDIVPPPL